MTRKPAAKPASTEPQWPADVVERWPIGRLTDYERNARTHSDSQIAAIAASIKQFGFTNPVLVTENGMIIAGHARVAAAHQLEFEDIPVMVARGWTRSQIRAYVIADNQLALSAGWDDALLAEEISDLKVDGFDISLLGFGAKEIEAILDGWASDIEAVERGGSHTDGITEVIKVSVAQDRVEDARVVIHKALADAAIPFESA